MSGSAFDVLARIRANRAAPEPVGERCEMCSETIADEHQHVVNVEGRQLMCVCRGCYLLFTDTDAELRYRAVPDRYLAFPDFAFDRRRWEALQIPVGLAFFFHNSALDRTVGFYPGPAGATESELDLGAWDGIRAAEPRVDLLAFALGSGVAGLGGCALSQIGNVGPELGQGFIVDSFMVVVLGGVGQLAGTVAAALGLGQVNKLLEPTAGAVMAKIAVLVFVILFIQRRPQGLFAQRGRSSEEGQGE